MDNDKNDRVLNYIHGFLDSLAMINTFDNDGKTYYAVLLDKDTDEVTTIKKHLGVKNWRLDFEKIAESWRAVLAKEARPYFTQVIAETFTTTSRSLLYNEDDPSVKISKDALINSNQFNFDDLLIPRFLDCIGKIAGSAAEFYRVRLNTQVKGTKHEGFYDNYYNDYFFDLGAEILFLHFGGVD